MRQGMTVALATVLLASLMGAASLPFYPYFDQYSPLPPNLPEGFQEPQSHPNWKHQETAKGHLATKSTSLSVGASGLTPFLETMRSNGSVDGPLKIDLRANDRQSDFTSDGVTLAESGRLELKNPKLLKILEDEENLEQTPPEEDAFVANDNFQDQGPGSVEMYKLDLFKDKSVLSPVLPRRTLSRAKSKTPKKANASQVNWKPKTVESEVKTTRPKVNEEMNFFAKFPSDSVKDEVFGVGGVPELQVGCEGLEAWHRQKRSETSNDNRNFDPTLYVTPLSVDLDLSEDEEDDESYEEMDELLKIQKMLSTTKKPPNQKNRGDIEATLKTPADIEAKLRKPDKLPVRGDLGESTGINTTTTINTSLPFVDNGKIQGESKSDRVTVYSAPISRQYNLSPEKDTSPLAAANYFGPSLTRGRKLLSIMADDGSKRRKRENLWGFGEDEGLIANEELQPEEEKREQEEEIRKMEREFARRLEVEEEDTKYQQFTTTDSLVTQKNAYLKNERVKEKQEQNLTKQTRKNGEHFTNYLGLMKKREENRERQWENMERGRQKEKKMTEERRWQEEEWRKLEEQVRSGNYPIKLVQSEPSHSSDVKMRIEEDRRMQEQDRKLKDYIQRNRPITVVRLDDRETIENERRITLERERNRPSNSTRLTTNDDRDAWNTEGDNQKERKEEERRRRAETRKQREEEEKKLQDYIKRNQPISVSRRINDPFQHGHDAWEQRRRMEEARKYDRRRGLSISRDKGRNRGPSSPTSISPQRVIRDESWRKPELWRLEGDRRILERLRYDEEEMRKELARREEEHRRAESRRYEEDRKRQETIRLEAEKKWKELIEEEERRARTGRREPSWIEEARRRQETSLAPANLVSVVNRKRQEQDRRQLEARRRAHSYERRRQDYERRLMEQKRKGMGTTSLRDYQTWKRQEEERLNSLPVSARILIRSREINATKSPLISFDTRFKEELDTPGINPYHQGLQAARFPVPATQRPPVKGPGVCVWAILQCCSSKGRLNSCFESVGCPGISWDPDPCRSDVVEAARKKVMQFYNDDDNN